MASLPQPTDIFAINPYETHPGLSPLEAEVLWEYAKLAQNLKLVRPDHLYEFRPFQRAFKVTAKTRKLSEEPDQLLLTRLRSLEKKMGLVLTLVRQLVKAKSCRSS